MKRLHAMPGSLRRLARRHLARLGVVAVCVVGVVGVSLGDPLGIGVTLVAPASAQQPVESGIQRTYLNKLSVNLPIEIEANQRAQLKGLVLFMKEGIQGAWRQIDQGGPQQTEFVFQAPREGEYWFRIVAVDVQGRSHPSDLSNLQDVVVVVVDATPPAVDVRFVGVTIEGTTVQCECRDANLDPLQTRFLFQTQDQVWRPLDPIPGRAGLYCIPAQAVLTNLIKISAADLAHNATARTFNLGEIAQGMSSPAPQTAANLQSLPAIPPYVQKELPLPPTSSPRTQSPYASSRGQAPQVQAPQLPLITNATPTTTKSTEGAITVVTSNEEIRTPHEINPQVRQTGAARPPAGRTDPMMIRPGTTGEPAAPIVANSMSRQPTAPTQIVGSPTVFLNYEFENQGASGVGKIEIWATTDNCRTWVKMVDDPTRKNPAELHFPGEGVFGVKLVASNGRGYGAEPPQSGDPADSWIEVDTTKPKAKIVAVQCGSGPDSGVLTVFWTAEDKNLAADGIDLYYSASSDGPWSPIAKNMHNDKGIEGQYRWTPPSQAGAQTYLRLVVHDQVGNTAISQTVQPIPLDDLSRPRVRLVNVSTVAQTPVAAPAAPASLSAPAEQRPANLRPVQATSIPESTTTGSGPNLIGIESR